MKPRKILEVSTAHITKKDNDFLTKQAEICSKPNKETSKLFVETLTYGFLIIFPDQIKSQLSAPLKAIINKAIKKDCSFIFIDRDAPVHKNLKTFYW